MGRKGRRRRRKRLIMSFISVLDNIGTAFKDVLQAIVAIGTDAEPVVDDLFPTFAGVYNEAIQIITEVEAIASGLSGSSANINKQKLVIATALLHPKVVAQQAALKIAPPTVAQTQAYVQSVVDGLNSFAAVSPKKQ
jgi:hypothetical protein